MIFIYFYLILFNLIIHFFIGYTPLIVSCFKGYYEIVRILLEKNADINKKNKLGQLPILFCFSRLEEETFKYENKKICMMMLDLLISKGADINIKIDQYSGYTILMKLASNEILDNDNNESILEIIQFLIERGANVNLRGNDNKSVFDVIENSKNYDYLLRILNNTSQSVFFNTLKEESDFNREKMLAENNNIYNNKFVTENETKFPGCRFPSHGEKDMIYECNPNNPRMNCCLIF